MRDFINDLLGAPKTVKAALVVGSLAVAAFAVASVAAAVASAAVAAVVEAEALDFPPVELSGEAGPASVVGKTTDLRSLAPLDLAYPRPFVTGMSIESLVLAEVYSRAAVAAGAAPAEAHRLAVLVAGLPADLVAAILAFEQASARAAGSSAG